MDEDTDDAYFRSLRVTPLLPSGRGEYPNEGAEILLKLYGAKVVAIGAPSDPTRFEGGGLVIDYQPPNSSETRRLILVFSELGMGIEYEGALQI